MAQNTGNNERLKVGSIYEPACFSYRYYVVMRTIQIKLYEHGPLNHNTAPLFFSRKKNLENSLLIFAKNLLLLRLDCNSSDSVLHLSLSGRKGLPKGVVAWYQWLTIFKPKKHRGWEWNGLIGNEKIVNQIVGWSYTSEQGGKTSKNRNLLFL